ncbi:hypothetical protein C5S53_17335 [Methanophagales archaeon]|nr:hypothetical protein C5S53_17335 [Methanophagales archaeon]
MNEFFKDDEIFAYNLSAFLSAARSITLYMQKQYKHQEGFEEWYIPKRKELFDDLELQYLKHARNEDLKTESVPTVATRINRSTVGVTIVEKGTPETEQVKKAEIRPHTQSNPETVRRFFPKFPDVDVRVFCEEQLIKLTRIVKECEDLFL